MHDIITSFVTISLKCILMKILISSMHKKVRMIV